MDEFLVGEWIDWFIIDNHLYEQVYTNTGVKSYVLTLIPVNLMNLIPQGKIFPILP